jgi:hypothetical protein
MAVPPARGDRTRLTDHLAGFKPRRIPPAALALRTRPSGPYGPLAPPRALAPRAFAVLDKWGRWGQNA